MRPAITGPAVALAFPASPPPLFTRRMATEIVGREEELSSLRAFLDGARRGPATLVLEGEAGIGKSTLWEAASSTRRD
jgi:Cdc6-like AAA superfamily ATPase